MAKTLAQGRKPGSGRKPGKAKTLAEGRKPGSGRKKGSISKTLADGRKAGSGRKKGAAKTKNDHIVTATVPIYPNIAAKTDELKNERSPESILLHAANQQYHHPIDAIPIETIPFDQAQQHQGQERVPEQRLTNDVAGHYTVHSLDGDDRTVQVRYSDLKQLLLNNTRYDANSRYVQMLEAGESGSVVQK